jgi:hypothetical protein
MKKLAIIGAGSAGLQSLCHYVYWLPKDWEITVIHDPQIPALAIGESTNVGFINIITRALDFQIEDMGQIDATHKFGTLFKGWREKDFMPVLIHALHFNTFKFKDYVLPRIKKLWGDKVVEVQGRVNEIHNLPDRVDLDINGEISSFDYVINSMGFPKDFTNYTMYPDYMANHCLVHNVQGDYSQVGNTGHLATEDGWMFEVPLATRMSYGYVFNNKITPVETAKENFSKTIGVPVDQLENIEFKFTSYHNNEVLKGRVMQNGNQAYFFEPMFGNSLMTYHAVDGIFLNFLMGRNTVEQVNQRAVTEFKKIRDTLYYKYHGGSNHDTPFWKNAVERTKNFMEDSDMFRSLLDADRQNHEIGCDYVFTDQFYPYIVWKRLDKTLGYNYFNHS